MSVKVSGSVLGLGLSSDPGIHGFLVSAPGPPAERRERERERERELPRLVLQSRVSFAFKHVPVLHKAWLAPLDCTSEGLLRLDVCPKQKSSRYHGVDFSKCSDFGASTTKFLSCTVQSFTPSA